MSSLPVCLVTYILLFIDLRLLAVQQYTTVIVKPGFCSRPLRALSRCCHHVVSAGVAAPDLVKLAMNEDSVECPAVADTGSTGNDTAKKLRNLQKKLKQIQQLKEKRDANDLSALTPEQIQKLRSEDSVLAEVQQLELSA